MGDLFRAMQQWGGQQTSSAPTNPYVQPGSGLPWLPPTFAPTGITPLGGAPGLQGAPSAIAGRPSGAFVPPAGQAVPPFAGFFPFQIPPWMLGQVQPPPQGYQAFGAGGR